MLHAEFIEVEDALLGPTAAMRDAWAMAQALALNTGRDAWQAHCRAWRPGDDPAGDLPQVTVFGGWRAASNVHLLELMRRDAAIATRLQAVHAAGGHVVTVHNGVAMLAPAGLLAGHRCVIPWPYLGALLKTEPRLQLAHGEPWVEDGRIWTVGAPSAAGEVAFELAARFGLGPFAAGVREVLEVSPERQGVLVNFASRLKPRAERAAVDRASRWIDEHLHEPFQLSALAAAVAMSERTLLRKFRLHFGLSPVQFLHRRRVAALRMLLETTYYPVDRVAELCGWKSAAMMRKVFKQETGMTPDAWRKAHSVMPPRDLGPRAGVAAQPSKEAS